MALLVAFARDAGADATVELTYRAPEVCPPQSEFVAAVTARGGHFEGADAPSRVRNVDVSIEKEPDGFTGRLRVETGSAASAPREVHAPECSKVVEGLAVVAAIALREPPAPSAPLRLRGSSFSGDDAVAVEAGTLRFDNARTYSLGAGAQLGPFPRLLPRYDFALSFAQFVTPPALPSRLLGNVLQARWSLLGPATHDFGDGFSVHTWGLQAGVSSCRAFTYDTGGLVFMICAEFAVGAMALTTRQGGVKIQEKDAGFGIAALSFDAQYDIGSHLYLGLRAGGQIQLGDVSANRPDGSLLFQSGLFGAYATAGMGLHFP